MRVNIKARIDESLLNKAIEEFERDNYPYCSKNQYNYLIISEQTLNDLRCNHLGEFIKNSSDYREMYNGNRIAIDNSIPYGEVEIR